MLRDGLRHPIEDATEVAELPSQLHLHDDDVATPLNALSQLNLPPFSLAIISGLSWDDDMSPWGAKAIYKGDSDFGGRADLYLKLLLENIAPKVEQSLNENAIKVYWVDGIN